jgi:hypothetical protein
MENAAKEQDNRLATLVAILIALATVIGAVVAWRASVASDGSGDADFAGLRATVNLEETRALAAVTAYENYSAFMNYRRYEELGNLLVEEQNQAAEDEATALEPERINAHDLALANQQLFPNKFLNRDGSYALQREVGELFADAAKEKDLQPDSQYAEADKLRDKTNQLLIAVTVLAVALVFYTLVETVGRRLQYLFIGVGLLCTVAGSVMAFMVEFAA